MHEFFLTFDTEDFISENSVPGLYNILEHLKKNEITALFFISGQMAEKLYNFPSTIDLLNEHQIGYHSSSHSVHPTIFEFSDVKNYSEAYRTCLKRESSHINPLTGTIEGLGGIRALQAIFPKKQIVAYRAPGYCWSPPHLEALMNFGITYDFSTDLSIEPTSFRGITFYPFTILGNNWQGGIYQHSYLQLLTLKRETSVLTIHPSSMVNKFEWDLIYYPKYNKSRFNPVKLIQLPSRSPTEIASIFRRFDQLLQHLRVLQKLHILRVTPELKKTNRSLLLTSIDVLKCYKLSTKWAEGFGYKPQFLYGQFVDFFNINSSR